jgi:hypothetical protein
VFGGVRERLEASEVGRGRMRVAVGVRGQLEASAGSWRRQRADGDVRKRLVA